MSNWRGKHNHRLRRVAERVLDIALFNGLLASWSFRCGLHGRLGVSRHAITLPAARRLARPLTIAFASDFHAGPTTDPRLFAELADRINAEEPDLLLLGGDFVSGRATHAAVLAAQLSRCTPPLGSFAVFGNHDLWTDHDHIERQLADANVQMLVNRNVTLPAPYDGVSICGMDDPWTGEADMAATVAGSGATRILLMHAPDGLLLVTGERFDLGFAGHTHGGQVALRDGTPIIVPSGPLCRQFCHGRFDVEGGASLIVSRGIGCSSLPLRVNADPELVICTLN